MATTAHVIATRARQILGRPMRRPRAHGVPDWPAWGAIRTAATEAGYGEPLLGYVSRATSLRAAAGDYLSRYGQAYGLAAVPAGASPQAEREAERSVAALRR